MVNSKDFEIKLTELMNLFNRESDSRLIGYKDKLAKASNEQIEAQIKVFEKRIADNTSKLYVIIQTDFVLIAKALSILKSNLHERNSSDSQKTSTFALDAESEFDDCATAVMFEFEEYHPQKK